MLCRWGKVSAGSGAGHFGFCARHYDVARTTRANCEQRFSCSGVRIAERLPGKFDRGRSLFTGSCAQADSEFLHETIQRRTGHGQRLRRRVGIAAKLAQGVSFDDENWAKLDALAERLQVSRPAAVA